MNLRNFLSEDALNIKVLFISFSADKKQSEMMKRFKNSTFISWSDISIDDGEVYAKEEKLSAFKFIVVGTVGKNIALNSCVRESALTHKIGIFNYGAPTEQNNKLLQTIKMKQLDIPQIKTVIGKSSSFTANSLIRKLKLPIISKITNGSQGKGIEKHDTKESLETFLKKNQDETFIFQEFIPNDGDIRMFYVKHRLIYTITRKSQKETEFRNNVSLGGKAEYIDATPEIKKLGGAAVKAMGLDVTGVDLIQHKRTKKWYIMEINAAPQFWGVEMNDVCSAITDFIK